MIELGEVIMIVDLHRQGLSVSAIALQLGIDRKKVRKYLARGLEAPVYGPRQLSIPFDSGRRDEPLGAEHGARPAGQPPVGGRRRRGGRA